MGSTASSVSAATSHLFGSFPPRLRVNQISRTLSWWTALTRTWTPNEVVVVVSFCCRALKLSYCDAKTWPQIPRALNLSSSVIGNSCSQILVFHVPHLLEQIKFYI